MSVDDVIAAVDVERLARDEFRSVHREEGDSDTSNAALTGPIML